MFQCSCYLSSGVLDIVDTSFSRTRNEISVYLYRFFLVQVLRRIPSHGLVLRALVNELRKGRISQIILPDGTSFFLACVISGDQKVTEDPHRYTSTMKMINPIGVGAGWSVGWQLVLGRTAL